MLFDLQDRAYDLGEAAGRAAAVSEICAWLEAHEDGNFEFYPPPWEDAAREIREKRIGLGEVANEPGE